MDKYLYRLVSFSTYSIVNFNNKKSGIPLLQYTRCSLAVKILACALESTCKLDLLNNRHSMTIWFAYYNKKFRFLNKLIQSIADQLSKECTRIICKKFYGALSSLYYAFLYPHSDNAFENRQTPSVAWWFPLCINCKIFLVIKTTEHLQFFLPTWNFLYFWEHACMQRRLIFSCNIFIHIQWSHHSHSSLKHHLYIHIFETFPTMHCLAFKFEMWKFRYVWWVAGLSKKVYLNHFKTSWWEYYSLSYLKILKKIW